MTSRYQGLSPNDKGGRGERAWEQGCSKKLGVKLFLSPEASGQVQRHSGFEWLCKHNRLRPEPIRFVRLDLEHAQSDGKSVNRGLPVLD